MYSRILLTRMKYIGDVVLTTPVIKTLREAFPNSYIAYLGEAKAVSLLEHNPFIDEIIPFDFSKDSALYQLKMYTKMYAGNYDLTIDLFSNPRSALMTFATRAKVRIGGNARGRGNLYTIKINDDGALKSAIDYHYQSLKPLGIQPKYYKTEIFITDAEKKGALELLRSLGVETTKNLVAIHPGATWPNKIWLKEHFSGLISKLVEQTDVEVLLRDRKSVV